MKKFRPYFPDELAESGNETMIERIADRARAFLEKVQYRRQSTLVMAQLPEYCQEPPAPRNDTDTYLDSREEDTTATAGWGWQGDLDCTWHTAPTLPFESCAPPYAYAPRVDYEAYNVQVWLFMTFLAE